MFLEKWLPFKSANFFFFLGGGVFGNEIEWNIPFVRLYMQCIIFCWILQTATISMHRLIIQWISFIITVCNLLLYRYSHVIIHSFDEKLHLLFLGWRGGFWLSNIITFYNYKFNIDLLRRLENDLLFFF